MSNLKKVVALALALALVMTMFAGATIKTDLPYRDVEAFTDAQLSAAAILKPLGITEGTGAGELGAGTLTRAQMVTFIYRLLNGGDAGVQNYYSKTSIFDDVDPEAWYAPYINWAYASKIVEGYGKTFGPDDNVTGAQAAAMLVRIFGKVVTGADYAQKAEAYAIAYRLDYGVETKGVFENDLSRGDMFIFLANALLVEYEKDHSLATDIFDLEVINGAILLGEEKIGSNGYTKFAFRVGTAGDVKYFWTNILCVEEDSDVFDDYGCKFTLLVSKDQINQPTYNQGYRWLYAAYEESQNAYYKVVTGTVDDGKLVFAGKNQNVFFDKNVFVYVNGKASTVDAFIASYGVRNGARYKLIDNDGDGEYEFAIIERLRLGDLKTETVNAKVVAVNADGTKITLQKADGTKIEVVVGEFWLNDYSDTANNGDAIRYALGINQPDFRPYTAISDVYYDFVVGGKYVFGINVAANTKFNGSYGIFVQWWSPLDLYKNMPYALFVNEQSEYFSAYVKTVNEAPAAMMTFILGNSLIYFTDGDASDDVVSFDTANFWNSNYTYRELFPFIFTADNDAGKKLTVPFEMNVVSKIQEKEVFDYTDVALFKYTYAVFDEEPVDADGNPLKYWNVAQQKYVAVKDAFQVTQADNRTLTVDGEKIPLEDYTELEGKWLVLIKNSAQFYGIEDMEECIGFVYVTDAEITVTIAGGGDDVFANELQIYRNNGFWHLRAYADVPAIDDESVGVFWNGFELEYYYNSTQDKYYWAIALADGTDPEDGIENSEHFRMAELIKGFDDDAFTEAVQDEIAKFIRANSQDQDAKLIGYDYRIKIDKGVVFAYGTVLSNRDHDDDPRGYFFGESYTDALEARWVAYDVTTFNSNFGLGYSGNDTVPFGYTQDEMIFTFINGNYYVKALKVSDSAAARLPYGWLKPNGYQLAIFGGFVDGVNTEGWGIQLVTISKDGINAETAHTKVGLAGAAKGDVLLIKRDANGTIIEITPVSTDFRDYLSYAGFNPDLSGSGTLTSADKVCGFKFRNEAKDQGQGDYFEIKIDGSKTVYYVTFANDGSPLEGGLFAESFTWTTEFPKGKVGQPCMIYTAGNFVFVVV